jgi:hypothetical protein
MTKQIAHGSRPVFIRTLVFCLLLLIVTSYLVLVAETHQEVALGFLKPYVDQGIPYSKYFEFEAHSLLTEVQKGLIGLAGIITLTHLVFFRSASLSATLILLTAFSAIYGQIAFALKDQTAGAWGYGIAILLAGVFCWISPKNNNFEAHKPASFKTPEALLFVSLFTLALFFRFYALNRILHFFDGEHAPFLMAANDLRGMHLANVGDNGPWSPFGYSFYLNVYACTKLFGTTILATRFSTAIPAMVMIFLSYFFLRNLFSRQVALVGILILALDAKQISWSRFEFPHHGPALPAMLICWLTYLSFESKKLLYPILLALMMGFSFHQYPSGQTSFLIPWIYVGYLLLFNRRYKWTVYASRLPFMLLGVALWYYGYSIALYFAYDQLMPPTYFARFDGRVSWKGLPGELSLLQQVLHMLSLYWQNCEQLFGSMIVRLSHPHPPQELTPDFGYLSLRTVFLLVPPFFLVALARLLTNIKWKEGALLMCWFMAGILPAILSNEGVSRRAASIFPMLIFFAATGYEFTRSALLKSGRNVAKYLTPPLELATATAILLATFHQILSGIHLPYREPAENVVVRKLSDIFEPRSLIFIDYVEHYMPGKLTFLLLDYFNDEKNKPMAWVVLEESSRRQLIKPYTDPRIAVNSLQDSMFYRWTSLYEQLPMLKATQNWDNLIYILVRFPNTEESGEFEQRYSAMKGACQGEIQEILLANIPNMYPQFKIFKCTLAPSSSFIPPPVPTQPPEQPQQ